MIEGLDLIICSKIQRKKKHGGKRLETERKAVGYIAT